MYRTFTTNEQSMHGMGYRLAARDRFACMKSPAESMFPAQLCSANGLSKMASGWLYWLPLACPAHDNCVLESSFINISWVVVPHKVPIHQV